jgi:hypothetical protein
MFPVLGFALAAMITLAAQTSVMAADRIRLAVQRTGTLAWELDVIRTHGTCPWDVPPMERQGDEKQ